MKRTVATRTPSFNQVISSNVLLNYFQVTVLLPISLSPPMAPIKN